MSKKSLLIINRAQFGYHTDSFKYCQYLKNDFNITYICFYGDKEKISEDGVEVVYVPYKGSFIYRGIGFIRNCRQYIKSNKIDLIFIVYFQMSSLLRIGMPSNKFILDIRTGAIGTTAKKRKIDDTLMSLESKAFKHITIISESLRDKFGLRGEKCHILPLGADELSTTDKSFDSMKLLYVGTFLSRNIEETIFGISQFLEKIDHKKVEMEITYDIFGFGTVEEEVLVKNAIMETGLEDIVKFHGRKNHEDLKFYYDNCNIGITYVPLIDYFECQPPTKIFEYARAGLLGISTSTLENKRLITEDNGVLCDDTVGSFSDALENIYINREKFDSRKIRKTLANYSWNNIVNNNLATYLKQIGK